MYKAIKTALDKVLAFFGIVFLFFPLMLVALAIKIDSPGPAFFRQERVGMNEKRFKVFKFRTMKRTDVVFDIDHPVIGNDNENLTRVGKVIRRLKIDEFLQLINVLIGDMSLIGPRPLMPVYLERYEEWEKEKFTVKPGMSGLSQIRGNGHLSSVERSFYDVVYTRNVSFSMDVEILFKTLGVVVFGEERYLRHVDPAAIAEMRGKRDESRDKNADVGA